MPWFNREFINALPKTDLHLHLDGSLRINTLIELAQAAGVALPAPDEKGLRELVFKDSYEDLGEYLRGFGLTTAVMQTPDALMRVANELMLDNAAEGVRYLEVRFAPQLLMSESFSFAEVMNAVDQGLRQARDELNGRLSPDEAAYDYGIIVCAMRFFTRDFSPYYRDFCRVHASASRPELTRLASLELARAAVQLHAESNIQLVGFDIAGAENGFPACEHTESYALIHKTLLGKTVHAGEAYGPESIYQALTQLHADRIGHGLHLFDAERVLHPKTKNRAEYVERLVSFLADRRITLEVCLSSNLQTTPTIGELAKHPFGKMLERGLSLSLCTDNRLVSNTSVSREIELALTHFPIDAKRLKTLVMTGFQHSFFYRPYAEKQAYIARVARHYDAVAKQFGLPG